MPVSAPVINTTDEDMIISLIERGFEQPAVSKGKIGRGAGPKMGTPEDLKIGP